MPFKYHSGEEIKPGDRVLVDGEPGEVEFVSDPDDPLTDPNDWYIATFGGGVMVVEPKVFGRVFLREPESKLDFVARANSKPESD